MMGYGELPPQGPRANARPGPTRGPGEWRDAPAEACWEDRGGMGPQKMGDQPPGDPGRWLLARGARAMEDPWRALHARRVRGSAEAAGPARGIAQERLALYRSILPSSQ